MSPTVTAERSESETGRWPTTADERVAGSNACTTSVPETVPPPKTKSFPPIMAPAPSWNASVIEPSDVSRPVAGFNAKTPDAETSEESSPPARYTVRPSRTATSRWTGAASR